MSYESSTQTDKLSVCGIKEEKRARVGRPQTSYSPSNLTAGRPKAALPFRFVGEFKYGVLLFIVVLLFINIEISKIDVKY